MQVLVYNNQCKIKSKNLLGGSMQERKPSFIALVPFILFIVSYLAIGSSLVFSGESMGFYQFKAPIAVIIGIIAAFFMIKGNVTEKFDVFIKGCGDENIIIMCIIYILAGAFSTVSKQMGGVDATVNLGLSIIPPGLITVGLFVIACFISISTGTSVGTIVALGPIAVGFAEKTTISMPLIIATLIGGAMFGDNLSVISDTTIAATRTQGVEMKDKFRANIAMAVPAMIVTIILLIIFGRPEVAPIKEVYEFDFIKVLPYIFVLVASVVGVNVFVVLVLGTMLSGAIGIATGAFGFLEYSNLIYDGFVGMFEIFILSMLTGGLAGLVGYGGGLDWLLNTIKSFIKSRRSAEIGIGLITSLTDMATANNTVAMIIDGPIVRNIVEEYEVDPRRSAALMDTFGAIMQGLIPYGAQVLMAVKFTEGRVSPFEIMPLLWYQFALAFFVIVSMFIPFADGFIKRNPWDFQKWEPK